MDQERPLDPDYTHDVIQCQSCEVDVEHIGRPPYLCDDCRKKQLRGYHIPLETMERLDESLDACQRMIEEIRQYRACRRQA